MRCDAGLLQDQDKAQTIALEHELATLRERLDAQAKVLNERSAQISDLKEDRNHWCYQEKNLLADYQSTKASNKIIKISSGGHSDGFQFS